MAYAVRYQSAEHQGMLVEIPARQLAKAVRDQCEASDRIEAYYDTPDCARPSRCPPEYPYPHFEAVSAEYAHRWVRNDWPHETLLYVSDGKVRRAA